MFAGCGDVPDFDFLREAIVGGDVGIRLVDGRHQDVLAVGRGIERFVIGRLADGRDRARGCIDQRELRGGVVVEEIFVVLVLQRVASFVGAALALLAFGFLNARANGRIRFLRWRAQFLRHEFDQQRFLVGHPLHGVVQHRVEANAGHAMRLAGLGVADPQLDRVRGDVDEGETLAVGRPDRRPGAGARRQLDVDLLAVGDVHQVEAPGAGRDAVSAGSVVLAVIARLDAHSRQPQERRGHARDRRVLLPGDEQDRVVRRTHDRLRRRRRAHHVEDVFRRLVVSGGGISRLRHRHGLWGRWSSLRGSNNSEETDQQRSADRAAERVSNSHLFFPFCLDEIAWQTF